MPVYDYECKCGRVFEAIAGIDRQKIRCECGKAARRIISVNGPNLINEDASWIKTAVDVVDKRSDDPITRAFVKNPTRSNLRKYMKAKGLRHADPGEKFPGSAEFDYEKHADRLVRYRRKKDALEVSGARP